MKKILTKISRIVEEYPTILLLVVLMVCLIMRSYHLAELFPFTMDEEYQALLADNSIRTGHIPLIGVNVADTGLYLGPLFTWISAFLYWIGSGSPLVTAWAAVIVSLATCWLMVKTIQIITKDYWLGLVGGLMYSVNPLLSMYDHKFWNPSLVMLLTVFWLYSLIRAKNNHKWWWGVALVFGLAFHTHYSLFVLLVPTFYEVYKQGKFVNKIIFKLAALIFLCISPLIFFEIRHGFVQTKGLTKYLFQEAKSNQQIWERFGVWYDGINRFLWLGFHRDFASELSLASASRSILLIPISLLFVLIIWYLYKSKKYNWYRNIVLQTLLSYFLATFIFKSRISEYYFLPLFPLLIILIILSIAALIKINGVKSEFWIGAILAVVLVTWSAQSLTFRNSLGMKSKINLMHKIKTLVKGQPYELEAKGRYAYEGYRYLAQWQGITPSKSYMDGQFGWIYQPKENKTINIKVTIISKNDIREMGKLEITENGKLINTNEFIAIIE